MVRKVQSLNARGLQNGDNHEHSERTSSESSKTKRVGGGASPVPSKAALERNGFNPWLGFGGLWRRSHGQR